MSVFEWVLVGIAFVCVMVLVDGAIVGFLEARRRRKEDDPE